MSAKGKQVEKEDSLGDSSTGDTQLSLSAYVIIFGVFGGLVATTEVFFDFIPAWEILVSVVALYMSQVFREWVLQICLDLDMEVGTAVFLRRVGEMSLLAVAAIPILNSVGVHTTSLTAVLTSCTFALGLASQKALQNMAAGIMIMIFQPYKIGDRVELENVSGFVFDIQLSETLINTYDNERVSLPNSDIYGRKTKNLSRNKMVRICEQVSVPVAADLARTKQALLAAVGKYANEYKVQDTSELERREKAEAAALEREGTRTLIDRLDANQDGIVDAAEMVSGVGRAWRKLMQWRGAEGGITRGLHDLFQDLDADGNGKLTLSEILSLTGQQVKRCTQALRLKDERRSWEGVGVIEGRVAGRKFEMKGREPKPPQVVLQHIFHTHVVWEVHVWVQSTRSDDVKAALMEDILDGLKAAQAAQA